MKADSLLRGGSVVLPELDAPLRADLAIEDGRVLALLGPGQEIEAAREFDVEGAYILPGAIDPHVHVSWPYLGNRTQDDYATASRAAALGGTTSFIDFAIENRESPLAAMEARREQAERGSILDFSLHSVVSDATPQVLSEMADVVAAGVTSFKLYMTYRRRGLAVDDATLRTIAERAAELGAVVGVHAENADLDDAGTAHFQAAGMGEARYLPEAKPPLVEAEAIARAARIVASAGGRLWILHLSSAEGLAAAQAAREACGQPERLESCPQYLLLDRERLEGEDGHRFLCSPPLRDAVDRERLSLALADRELDWLGTDHCLFVAQQKDRLRDRFWDCPHGLPGVQTRPMLALALAERQGVGLNQVAAQLAKNAAEWFGLYPRKGTLLPGSDADLAVWRPGSQAVRNENLDMGCDWTPFEGMPAWRPPTLVMVRGSVVAPSSLMDSDVKDGHGNFLARPLSREGKEHE